MAPRGVELIVGAKRDPEWGPVVMVGLGGIWTEALGDVRLMPADSPREVVAEIGRLKGARAAARPARRARGRHRGIADVVVRSAR